MERSADVSAAIASGDNLLANPRATWLSPPRITQLLHERGGAG